MIQYLKNIKLDAQVIAGILLIGTIIWLAVRR